MCSQKPRLSQFYSISYKYLLDYSIVTESKPGQVRFQDFWAITFSNAFYAIGIDFSVKYTQDLLFHNEIYGTMTTPIR